MANAVLYAVAGVAHLLVPDGFVRIVPAWVPAPHAVVLATGICELCGVIGLLLPRLRLLAGACLALYAVCVFPANVNQALHQIPFGSLQPGWAYHGPRLLLQPVLVWAALFAAGLIDWPFARPAWPAPPACGNDPA